MGSAPNAAIAACAIDVARSIGVAVVNMSFGVTPSTALTDQINGGYFFDNMIFVAAAGNTYGPVAYPATLSAVMAVTAVDSANAHPSFAATGPEVELSAPGVDVLTTVLPSGTGRATGTSFAAPHVSAAAALLRARYPSANNDSIRRMLLESAKDLGPAGVDPTFGYGLLDIHKAIAPPPPPPALSVTVDGPDTTFVGLTYTWRAIVNGGVPPYSYQWMINGNPLPSATGPSTSYTVGDPDFYISVLVTSADSQVKLNGMFVRTCYSPTSC